MTQPPIRRLTLADLAILIAGTAGALVLLRMVHEAELFNQYLTNLQSGYRVYCFVAPFLLMASVSLIVVRLIGNRPRLRRVLWQPGTIACVMFLLSFVLDMLLILGQNLLRTLLNRTTFIYYSDIRLVLMSSLLGVEIVAVSWATLALSGRWRPEPSWIDRSGRILGVVIILSGLAARLFP
jgi:hypothetical protein